MVDNTELHIVTIASDQGKKFQVLKESCTKYGHDLIGLGENVPWISNAIKLRILKDYLTQLNPTDLILFVDAYDVIIRAQKESIINEFKSFECDILFSAEANFYFQDPSLRYYYWKYYPRSPLPYNYLNSGTFMGSASSILRMLDEISSFYQVDFYDDDQVRQIKSDQYLFSRYYIDSYYKTIETKNKVKLDHGQQLFGCTGGRQFGMPSYTINWIHRFLYFRFERKLLRLFKFPDEQNQVLDYHYDTVKDEYQQKLTSTAPKVLHFPRSENKMEKLLQIIQGKRINFAVLNPVVIISSFAAYFLSSLLSLLILIINLGVTNPGRLFRYRNNQNPEFTESVEAILQKLKDRKPFAFAHFNDGELTFIKKHLEEDKKETWYGRGQQKYTSALGELLTESIQIDDENFFVGVPCSTCWSEHRDLANKLRSGMKNTIPAMVFHHNLNYLPSIIGQLHNRTCYFIANEKQDFSLLEKLGVNVIEKNRINVPFVNSYLLFEELKNKKFEEGSVVILTCGMLAKILIPELYKRNPETSFIALGSSMDDLIQKDNMRFILFPKKLPFTANLYPTKFFLFGRKKPCNECYRI